MNGTKYTATFLVRCHGYTIEMTVTGDQLDRWLQEIQTLLNRLRSRGAEPAKLEQAKGGER